MTRRDLMKFFGVGAVIAPVALTPAPVQARIIEPPKVELIETALTDSSEALARLMRKPIGFSFQIRDLEGTAAYAFEAEGAITGLHREVIDVTHHGGGSDGFRSFIPGVLTITVEISGVRQHCRVIPS